MAQASLHHGETLTLKLPTLPRHNTYSLDINIRIRLLSMLVRSEVPVIRKPTRCLPAVKAIDQAHTIHVLLAASPSPRAPTPARPHYSQPDYTSRRRSTSHSARSRWPATRPGCNGSKTRSRRRQHSGRCDWISRCASPTRRLGWCWVRQRHRGFRRWCRCARICRYRRGIERRLGRRWRGCGPILGGRRWSRGLQRRRRGLLRLVGGRQGEGGWNGLVLCCWSAWFLSGILMTGRGGAWAVKKM
jgi:hypothetical protein